MFIWNETGKETEIDELEERLEQFFIKQTDAIVKHQTKEIDRLIQVIKEVKEGK